MNDPGPRVTNLAKTNQSILLAIRTAGTRRAADESYFEATLVLGRRG